VSDGRHVRVTSYNVHGFRAGIDAVASVVAGVAPDVLLLQETGSRRALRRFASAVGMSAVADPPSPLRRRVKDAVLVRDPLGIGGHRFRRFRRSRFRYPRGCLAVRVDEREGSLWAISVHLGLDGPERGRHARELVELVDELERSAPVVLGGDLNATPDARAVRRIADRLRDVTSYGERAPTFPASAPVARIDHLFASAGLRVEATSTGAAGAAGASDHLPVTVELVRGREAG
jgi:endonuclease/exonuclease/phosphatase family metal-dependent hydrolase